jgi:hypothetical protein
MEKPTPYDNGKIKIGLLWKPAPPKPDFDMEAIQQAICPPSNRLVKTSIDEWLTELIEGAAILALIVLFLVLVMYPQTIFTSVCR